jgi:hypothetical protein
VLDRVSFLEEKLKAANFSHDAVSPLIPLVKEQILNHEGRAFKA